MFNKPPGWGNRPEIETERELLDWFLGQVEPFLEVLNKDQCIVAGGINTSEKLTTVDKGKTANAEWVLRDAVQRVHDWWDYNGQPGYPPRPGEADGQYDARREVSKIVSELKCRVDFQRPYMENGRVWINGTPIRLEGSQQVVLDTLVDLGAASKPELENKSEVSDAVAVLKKLAAKHPNLGAYITFPGGKGMGGYRTSIRRGKAIDTQ